ncbi:hypothetical protein [Labilithrix luteola]|uniref:hypothetical protein n=1 Tax=Labilithrix luteola TaxID=1391654 RepID=UPI0011BA729E|nr:hypothetical protein [Labilithrix luteola]
MADHETNEGDDALNSGVRYQHGGRSEQEGDSCPCSSKVQMHVLQLSIGHRSHSLQVMIRPSRCFQLQVRSLASGAASDGRPELSASRSGGLLPREEPALVVSTSQAEIALMVVIASTQNSVRNDIISPRHIPQGNAR